MSEGKTTNPIALYELMGERTTQPFAIQLLDRLMPLSGLSIIDVAAGTGGLAIEAIRRGAKVKATDISPGMVARAAERLRGSADGSAEVMDCRSLNEPAHCYDIGVSNFGILSFPFWREAFDELSRLIRPQGHIAMTMWTQEDDCAPAYVLRRVFKQLFPHRDLWPSEKFPFTSVRQIRSCLVEAGCLNVDVGILEAIWRPMNSARVVEECDPMFRNFPGYANLDLQDKDKLQQGLKAAFGKYAGDTGDIALPCRAFIAITKITAFGGK